MTHGDQSDLAGTRWPALATLPTTAAVIAAAILLDFLTMFAWALGRELPDGWLWFLGGLHGIGTAHFGLKRHTWDPSKGATASNGGSAGSAG